MQAKGCSHIIVDVYFKSSIRMFSVIGFLIGVIYFKYSKLTTLSCNLLILHKYLEKVAHLHTQTAY